MTKQTLIVLALILVALLGWVTWAVFQPPAARPNVKVRFTGYTNDTTGIRIALFTVSNIGPSAVRRFSNYMIQIPTGARWTPVSAGLLSGNGSVLQAGSSETVTVPAATNQSWRVSISVNPEVGIMGDMMVPSPRQHALPDCPSATIERRLSRCKSGLQFFGGLGPGADAPKSNTF